MTIILYLGIAGISVYLCKFAFYSKQKVYRYVSWIAIIGLLSVLAAFRGNTGTDSLMYRTTYENINAVSRIQSFESGYVYLVKILNAMHLPYQSLFFVMSMLTVIFLMLFIQNEKENIDVSVAVFLMVTDLYLSAFNLMRQGLAIAILLYAYAVFLDKKYFRSIILIIFAMFFHKSALIGFAVIGAAIIFKRRHSKAIMVSCFLILLYLVFHREILGDIVYFIVRNKYYVSYITRDAATDATFVGYITRILPILFISTIFIKQYQKEPKFFVFYVMMIGGYILSLLGVFTATMVQRVGFYFSYLYIVVLAYCANRSWCIARFRFNKNIIKFLVCLYAIVMFFYSYVIRGFSNLIPYQGLFKIK